MKHRPRKRFGQNFLLDSSVIDQIVSLIDPDPLDTLVEIGPGRGALTLPILAAGCDLHAVEIDRDLIAHWRQQSHPNLTLHEGDALEFDFSRLGAPLRIIGNLPYNISTPLLFRFIEYRQQVRDIHVMLQKEVADRVCAEPGTKAYGRLTVMMALHFERYVAFDVSPDAFEPAPKVTSSVISMRPLETPPDLHNATRFALLVKHAFSMRRKTLRKSLKGLCSEADFAAAGIDSGLRPERLSAAQFVALSNTLDALL
ncbi:MAG: 16S rRNA (adenine(1518)-N(6)/adenine(1519)-N(6))-dimethyltransferase RsmA [Pseudomonadota bacterium]